MDGHDLTRSVNNVPGQSESPSASHPGLELLTLDSPFHKMVKHVNYLSDFADDVIRYKYKDGPVWKESEENLKSWLLPPCAAFQTVRALTEHREIVGAIKRAFNQQLSSAVSHSSLKSFFFRIHTFVIWCFNHDIYSFSDLDREDCNSFLKDLCQGRYVAIGAEVHLRRLIEGITVRDEGQRKERARAFLSGQATLININQDLVEQTTGISLKSGFPSWFVDELASLAGVDRSIFRDKGQQFGPITVSTASGYLETIKLLYGAEPGFDAPSFAPFAGITKDDLLAYGALMDGRTPNVPIDQAVKLMATSTVWMLDYSEPILELSRQCSSALSTKTGQSWRILRRVIAETLAEQKSRGIDLESLTGLKISTSEDLRTALKYLICACLLIILSNTGRRKGEITSTTYGLVYGCLMLSLLGQYSMRVYIEKTLKGYAQMPINTLVGKAIETLKGIQKDWRWFGAGAVPEDAYLFELSAGFGRVAGDRIVEANLDNLWLPKWIEHVLGTDSENVTPRTWRRLYAVLFYWRFDHPLLTALKRQLWHENMRVTFTYCTDSEQVEYADSIDQSIKRSQHVFEGRTITVFEEVDSALHQEMVTAEEEYLLTKLIETLTGKASLSGGFISSLFPIIKRHIQELQEKAIPVTALSLKVVVRNVLQTGHRITPMPHGNCAAIDTGTYDQNAAHCAKEGRVDRSKASPGVCAKCPNHMTHGSTMSFIEDEIQYYQGILDDFSLDEFEHANARRQLDQLEEIKDYHMVEFDRIANVAAEIASQINFKANGDDDA